MGSVTAKYSRTKRSVTRALYQYDYGQELLFDGFDIGDSVEVHFGNKGDETTIVRFGNNNGVRIPNELLKTGKDIEAWIYMHERQCNGESVYYILIPVMQRGMVGDDEQKTTEYILDGNDAAGTNGPWCQANEYIFDGRDTSNLMPKE